MSVAARLDLRHVPSPEFKDTAGSWARAINQSRGVVQGAKQNELVPLGLNPALLPLTLCFHESMT